LPGWAARLYV